MGAGQPSRLVPISIFVVAALVVLMDVVVMPVLSSGRAPSAGIFLNDFIVVLLAGLIGLFVSRRIGYPLWWRRGDGSTASRRATYVVVFLSVSVVAANTLIEVISVEKAVDLAPWIALLTPEMAAAVSVRAALTEEAFFRLFLFPLIVWVFRYFVKSRESSSVIGAVVSTAVFGLIHPGFLLAFLIGLAFVFIYYHRGLLPAMMAHFFADAIPFVLISMMLV